MVSYQDFLKVQGNEIKTMEFVRNAIINHKTTDEYKMADAAEDYVRRKNRTIREFQKLLYTIEGKAVPDIWSSNFKMESGFFQRFIIQENQYLLGNGTTWQNPNTGELLGDDFDEKLQEIGEAALVEGVAFGFWNNDHLDIFKLTEFVPLYDEEDGSMKAGIRFWQIDKLKPLRATLYEMDGYTDYIWGTQDVVGGIMHQKVPYKVIIARTEVDGEHIFAGENYPTFPIVPLWGNKYHQSELVGIREQIDCYDLIKSGFANTVDEGSIIYWLVQNAGGMDDVDMVEFVERIKTLHAAHVGDGQSAEPHTLEPPYQSREALLSMLRADLYEDAMALDTKEIAGGAATATQIRAAYENLNEKANGYEWCVKEFLRDILKTAGIDDKPTFTRSLLVNKAEEVNTVLQAAQYFDEEYMVRKLLTILGDADQIEDMLDRLSADEMGRIDGLRTSENRRNAESLGEEVDEGVQPSRQGNAEQTE